MKRATLSQHLYRSMPSSRGEWTHFLTRSLRCSSSPSWRQWRISLVVTLCVFLGALATDRQGQAETTAPEDIYFATDVVPLFTKHGCNGGGCHGKATGQNGFRLSLLGFEPDYDYESLTREAKGRRISIASPSRSLLLQKAVAAVPHGGGQRLHVDSDDYRVLMRWIERGAPAPRPTDPTLVGVEVSPREHVFEGGKRDLQLRVTARFSNGVVRDVTRQAVYQTNEPELVEVTEAGAVEVSNRSGLFAVMVRYGDHMDVLHGAAPATPVPQAANSRAAVVEAIEKWRQENADSPINRALAEQWRRLGVAPSSPVSDAEFVRRATLDICGALPTAEEVAAYVQDSTADKRSRLIDRLLERPEHASYFALKWADILRNRGRGYATSKQRHGTALFSGWLRDQIAANTPYDQFVTAILTASGNQETNPPTVWYRSVRTTPDYVESVAQAFLGVRIQCAQCHHHPAERWGQDDYYGLAAIFARVGRKGGFADAEVPTNETIFLASTGSVIQPRSGKVMSPRPLGGPDFELGRFDDPRVAFARWMTSAENPYFARTMVNRMWGHFLGRGIIHPIDDARSSNPPSNPELLDSLTQDFIAHGYDVRRLIRLICGSGAYGLSSVPNETNQGDSQSFARYYPRRLSAEVLLDAFSQVLDVPTKFPNVAGEFPVGTRAIELPDEAVPSHFLDVFGRPARNTACECERVDSPALGQTLELVSSQELQRKLTQAGGYVDQLGAKVKQASASGVDGAERLKAVHRENVQAIFLRALARPPRENEERRAVDFLTSKLETSEAYASLLWALLATNEFLFNH
ncbi:MAG: DUF1549 and DUF1553 domain-containing protein [Pirellulales bacterium]